MADLYGWSLRDIFEYVTPYDVRELTKYASPRVVRRENAQYRTIATIINVASYHEKGAREAMNQLLGNFADRDESYTDRPFDAGGLAMLKAKVEAARARK